MKYKASINILLGLLVAVILFHIAVIAKVIPYNIAWWGDFRMIRKCMFLKRSRF